MRPLHNHPSFEPLPMLKNKLSLLPLEKRQLLAADENNENSNTCYPLHFVVGEENISFILQQISAFGISFSLSTLAIKNYQSLLDPPNREVPVFNNALAFSSSFVLSRATAQINTEFFGHSSFDWASMAGVGFAHLICDSFPALTQAIDIFQSVYAFYQDELLKDLDAHCL